MVEEKKKGYIGPICDKCGKHRAILIPVLERRETMYGYEMVKIHICLDHFADIMENYEVLFPDDALDWTKPTPPNNDDNEDDEENGDEGCSGVLCEEETCIYNELGVCNKGTEIKLIKYADGTRGPLFLCDSFVKKVDSKR